MIVSVIPSTIRVGFFSLIFILVGSSSNSQDKSLLFQHQSKYFSQIGGIIYGIEQDSTGFLWFYGENQLLRYDGIRTTLFHAQENFKDLVITGLSSFRNGEIIVSSSKGLFVSHLDSLIQYSIVPDSVKSLNDVLWDGNHQIWVASNTGLISVSLGSGKVRHYQSADGLGSNIVHRLFQDGGSQLYASTWSGLAKYIPARDSFESLSIPNVNNYGSITSDASDRIWVSIPGQILSFSSENSLIKKINISVSDVDAKLPPIYLPWIIFANRPGSGITVANQSQWFIIRDSINRLHPLQTNIDLKEENVTAALYDKGHSLWMATAKGNIYRYDRPAFSRKSIEIRDQLQLDEYITEVASISPKQIMVGTSKRLYLFSLLSNYKVMLQKVVLEGHIRAIVQRNNYIWIATDSEIQQINIAKKGYPRENHIKLLQGTVSGIDIHDNICWVGTYNHGLSAYHINMDSVRHFLHHPGSTGDLSSNQINDLKVSDNKLIILHNCGVANELDLSSFTFRNVFPQGGIPNPGHSLNGIEFDGQEAFIATQNGIHQGREDVFSLISQTVSENIEDLLIKTDQQFWYISSGQLHFVDRTLNFKYYFQTKNLGYEGLGLAPFSDEYVLLFGRRNLDLVKLENDNVVEPSIRLLTSEKGFPVNTQEQIVLQSPVNSFEFDVALLDFREPDQIQIAYFLEGMDTSWQFQSGPRIRYNDLKSGNYTLRYKGANHLGIWSDAQAIEIRVLSNIWLSRFAITAYFVLFLALSILLLQYVRKTHTLKSDISIEKEANNSLRQELKYSLLNVHIYQRIDQKELIPEDIKLVKQLIELIDQNLSSASISVSHLAEEMGMSRIQLYRKIKDVLGISPSVFINEYRMKYAAELLKKNVGNISEVAYAVGFKNPAHFSESFKKHFQYSPLEYKKNHL